LLHAKPHCQQDKAYTLDIWHKVGNFANYHILTIFLADIESGMPTWTLAAPSYTPQQLLAMQERNERARQEVMQFLCSNTVSLSSSKQSDVLGGNKVCFKMLAFRQRVAWIIF